MAIHLEEDTNGNLVLDLSEENKLNDDPRFTDIILAFSTVLRTSNQVVLDVGNDLIEAVDYIIRSLQKCNVSLSLSTALDNLVQRYRGELTLVAKVKNSIVNGVANANVIQNPPVPDLQSSVELLPHQVMGITRSMAVQNFAEFSVQGSGKTAIVLCTFAIWKSLGEVEKVLVLGPISCFQPWEDESLRCFGNNIRIIRWSGSVSERTKLVPAYGKSDLILCSYDTACRDKVMLLRLLKSHKTLLVLDESHYIKNFNIGARGFTVLKLAPYALKRMILTGTPTPHSLQDLWSQFAFLWPNAYKTLIGTQQQYLELLTQRRTPSKELHRRLSPFFHRTTQNELKLPEPKTHFIKIPTTQISTDQLKIIRLLEMRILAEARLRLTSINDRLILAQWQRARIIRLLQAASNPGLLLSSLDMPLNKLGDVDITDLVAGVSRFQRGDILAAKIQWTIDKAKELIKNGNKVVIWTWWVNNLHLISKLLSDLNPLLLYGAIKPYEEETDDPQAESREKNIREFKNREDRPVIIANPAACAEAISLHKECHHAIYVDRTFNCGQFLQSLNRIHRVGLPSGAITQYWIPFIDCAVERSVDTRLKKRQEIMYEFLGDNSPVFGIDISEESDVADSYDETNKAYEDIVREIKSDKQ